MASTWTDEKVEDLRRLHAEGWSASAIAKRLNVSRNAVCGKLMRIRAENGQTVVKRRAPLKMRARGTAAITLPLAAPLVLPVAFLDLQPQHCRWPIDQGGAVLFCGAPKAPDCSYCAYHYRMATRSAAA